VQPTRGMRLTCRSRMSAAAASIWNAFGEPSMPRMERMIFSLVNVAPLISSVLAANEGATLTATMPTRQTISTSMDAVNHALEAATTNVTTPYSIALSKEAIRLVIDYLPTAIVEPTNLTARYWLMYASAIAGISFYQSMLHMTHVMEHAMSAINTKVTHGDGLGILMPAVVQEIYPAVPEVVADLFSPVIPGLKGEPSETDFVVAKLRAIPGVTCNLPRGAFYVYPNIGVALGKNGIADTLAFSERLLQESHVAVVPGGAFGTDAHVRISYATSMHELERGLDRLHQFMVKNA